VTAGLQVPTLGTWLIWTAGDEMEQINCWSFYLLGKWLDACYLAARQPLKLWNAQATQGSAFLRLFLDGVLKYRLDESRELARNLQLLLDSVIEKHKKDAESSLDESTVLSFNGAYNAFEQALGIELGRAPTFFVTAKGIFDTRRMITDGANVYEGFRDRLPQETINDTNESTRCMAFDLATASGFHIARATEAVIVKYMAAFHCPAPKKSQRNWGKYVELLEKTDANKKVVHHLDMVKDIHRNPLIHPEETLEASDATRLFSLCVSLIQGMVADMETKAATPSAEIVAMLPKDREDEADTETDDQQ
jgi:hypothetical protein